MKSVYKLPLQLFLLLLLPVLGIAQQKDFYQNEVPDDPYQPVSKADRQVGPSYQIISSSFFSVQVNVDDNGDDILFDAANEPSIAVNPIDPNRMVIGWRQFDQVSNNFRQAGFAYTLDAGQTWVFPGVINPGVFRSDPVLGVDAQGRFYYNSLTLDSLNIYTCDVYRSTGDGQWDAGTDAFGGDKQWMTIDKTEGEGEGNIYSAWTTGYSSCFPGAFTRSTDGGGSYENCTEVVPNVQWGSMDVGPDGVVYTASVGGGLVMSANAQQAGSTTIWQGTSASLDGYTDAFNPSSPNPGGLLGQVWVSTDHSDGPTHGNVYLLGSVQPISNSDPCEVMFNRSTDGGQTWGQAIRINDDNGTDNWQWFGTMSVAPNGRIDAVWLDTRDNPGTYLSSLYYAYSLDGGLGWSPNERLSEAFDPHMGWPNQSKLGDYFHMVSDDTGANLAWAATFGGGQNVYYGRITPTEPSASGEQRPGERQPLLRNYPNPCSGSTTIAYEMASPGHALLRVFNQLGAEVSVLDLGQRPAGQHTVRWETKDGQGLALPSGIYSYCLAVNGQVSGCKKMAVR